MTFRKLIAQDSCAASFDPSTRNNSSKFGLSLVTDIFAGQGHFLFSCRFISYGVGINLLGDGFLGHSNLTFLCTYVHFISSVNFTGVQLGGEFPVKVSFVFIYHQLSRDFCMSYLLGPIIYTKQKSGIMFLSRTKPEISWSIGE